MISSLTERTLFPQKINIEKTPSVLPLIFPTINPQPIKTALNDPTSLLLSRLYEHFPLKTLIYPHWTESIASKFSPFPIKVNQMGLVLRISKYEHENKIEGVALW